MSPQRGRKKLAPGYSWRTASSTAFHAGLMSERHSGGEICMPACEPASSKKHSRSTPAAAVASATRVVNPATFATSASRCAERSSRAVPSSLRADFADALKQGIAAPPDVQFVPI
jgi:hypothetical protein